MSNGDTIEFFWLNPLDSGLEMEWDTKLQLTSQNHMTVGNLEARLAPMAGGFTFGKKRKALNCRFNSLSKYFRQLFFLIQFSLFAILFVYLHYILGR